MRDRSRPWRVVVVVPAHNEERLLPRCLRSLRAAAALVARRGHRCRIVVVADACRDATVGLARAGLGGWGQVVEVDVRNVGLARALGVGHGVAELGPRPGDRVWLANTDADSAVPATWLRRQLAWAEAGVSGVAGVVRVDSFAEHPAGAAQRFAAHYQASRPHGAAPGGVGHGHVHGANLGLRLDAYRSVAGWSGAALSEDHALWDRLRAGGWPVVADPRLWVTTSGRRAGRAPGGFADALARLADPADVAGAGPEPGAGLEQ